jgi:hypothetical protein
MKALTPTLTDSQRVTVSELFDQKGPVLVEVRFVHMGTSPDWFLCDSATEFDSIWERLGPGVEVHLHSVWDLRDVGRVLVFGKE